MLKTALKKYCEIPVSERKNLVYPRAKMSTMFHGNQPSIYADFIASGIPSPQIESYIVKHIYSKYSNTHSNSTNGICMKTEIANVRDIVKRAFHIDDHYEILFKGSGSTDCINFLVQSIDYSAFKKIHIFISLYEHYSNHLPFVELARENNHIKLHIIPVNDENELDMKWFQRELDTVYRGGAAPAAGAMLVITSIIHCSNLTGYYTPIHDIKRILDSHKNAPHTTQYFFLDAACSAPYSANIKGNMFDAIFISPHKFIGGVGTPGLLIAKTCIFKKDHPINPGGSCVKKTHLNHIEYADDIEVRESSGTPDITGIIKIGQCLLLKAQYQKIITCNERVLSQVITDFIQYMKETYPCFFAIQYNSSDERMPILTFHIRDMHYNLTVVLLNDLFGIQTRGGKSCAGLILDHCKNKYGVDGFCRVSFHWTMRRRDIIFILNAIEFVVNEGEKYKKHYSYCKKDNLWVRKMKK